MKKKIKRICVIDTVYTLFLYYLICDFSKEDIFIISGGIPESIRNNINHIYFAHFKHSDLPQSHSVQYYIKRAHIIFKRFYSIIKLRIILFFKTRNHTIEVYGQGHLNFSFPLYEYKNSYIIEDGLLNYLDLEKPKDYEKFRKILHFFGFYFKNYNAGFGTHENIKKIFLTNDTVPEIIKEKTEIINIKELWDKKSEKEKNEILEIFNIKNIINKIDNNIILLLTQCFSQDKLISFEEEVNIYKYLIKKQNDDNIIIKKHPREKKSYEDIFPGFTIINQPFPLEILKCVDINITKVITVSSSSVLNFKQNCEIEIYDKKTSSDEINNAISALKKQI